MKKHLTKQRYFLIFTSQDLKILNPQVLIIVLTKEGKAQPPDSVPSAMLLLNKIISKCETDVTSVSISTPHFAKKWTTN